MTTQIDVNSLLRLAEATPVLVDVGSAGRRHEVWDPILSRAIVVGFDPDERNKDESFGHNAFKSFMVPKVVSPDPHSEQVTFNLARYPSCSSILTPDPKAVGTFSYRDFFAIEGTISVPATTLNHMVEEYGLDGIDWLKLDSQGIDLRLYRSMKPGLRDRLLAIDIEPGIVAFYLGEDTFAAAHEALVADNFWLADMHVQRYEKVRPETLERMAAEIAGTDAGTLKRRLAKAPTAIEGRYLRELGWLMQNKADIRSLVISFAFANLTNQLGFAGDILFAYEDLYGQDAIAQHMREILSQRLNIGPPPKDQEPATPPAGLKPSPFRQMLRKINQRVINRFVVLFLLKKLVTDPRWVWRKTLVRLGVRSRDAD